MISGYYVSFEPQKCAVGILMMAPSLPRSVARISALSGTTGILPEKKMRI